MQHSSDTVLRKDWNELQFISWAPFKRMAPSIIQLEISRLSELLQTTTLDLDVHNALVKVRYELKRFVECLVEAEKERLESTCSEHLISALINMPLQAEGVDEKSAKTLSYIVDRINYVYNRIPMIY